MVNQPYEAEIMTEYVIRGNTAVLKCSIPSFVADFVQVESWSSDEGQVFHCPSLTDSQEVYGKDWSVLADTTLTENTFKFAFKT